MINTYNENIESFFMFFIIFLIFVYFLIYSELNIWESILLSIFLSMAGLILISSIIEFFNFCTAPFKKEIKEDCLSIKKNDEYETFIYLLTINDLLNEKYNNYIKQLKVLKLKESKNNLLKMNPYDFEKLTAEVFNYFGFSSKVTKGSGDHGIDINLTKNGEKYIVQCKRYSGTIGTPLIRDFIGTMQLSGVNKGFFVTTGTFSLEVVKLINKNNFYIKLIDLDSLFNLITVKNDLGNINDFHTIILKGYENINNQAKKNIQNKKDGWNKYRGY